MNHRNRNQRVKNNHNLEQMKCLLTNLLQRWKVLNNHNLRLQLRFLQLQKVNYLQLWKKDHQLKWMEQWNLQWKLLWKAKCHHLKWKANSNRKK